MFNLYLEIFLPGYFHEINRLGGLVSFYKFIGNAVFIAPWSMWNVDTQKYWKSLI